MPESPDELRVTAMGLVALAQTNVTTGSRARSSSVSSKRWQPDRQLDPDPTCIPGSMRLPSKRWRASATVRARSYDDLFPGRVAQRTLDSLQDLRWQTVFPRGGGC